MNSKEEKYIDFASKISFYEFTQEEFRKPMIKVEEFKTEIEKLSTKKNWNINSLSDYVRKYPRSFLIFQEIFQLLRFTNAQLIHFVFDIDRLNSSNMNSIYEYMILNLKNDENFRRLYLNMIEKDITYEGFFENISSYEKKHLIATYKACVSKYIKLIIKDFDVLRSRIRRRAFDDFYIRFSNYLIENLKLNETLDSVRLFEYLKHKKIPKDTKRIHGNYPKLRINGILKRNGFVCIDHNLRERGISTLEHDISRQMNIRQPKGQKWYCTEKYVKGVVKPKNGKPKKFDMVIFQNSIPKYLFEVNFYSTSGTKIGINQGEYIDINQYITDNFKGIIFNWITDGNYWLTSDGKSRFLDLLNYFERIYNINLFEENIDNFF